MSSTTATSVAALTFALVSSEEARPRDLHLIQAAVEVNARKSVGQGKKDLTKFPEAPQGEPSGNCACYDYTYFEFARGPGQYIWLTMGAIEKDGQCSFRRFSPGSIEAGWGHYSGIDYSVVHSSLTGEHGPPCVTWSDAVANLIAGFGVTTTQAEAQLEKTKWCEFQASSKLQEQDGKFFISTSDDIWWGDDSRPACKQNQLVRPESVAEANAHLTALKTEYISLFGNAAPATNTLEECNDISGWANGHGHTCTGIFEKAASHVAADWTSTDGRSFKDACATCWKRICGAAKLVPSMNKNANEKTCDGWDSL